ncbi:MAG: hypothetical protein QOH66_385 [Actinomycetota bacterium]|nr:hypothetical protein [Actinomycetota bacterium]
MPGLPTYVERGGEISCRHPATIKDLRLYGFVIEADRNLLDEFCRRNFNYPSGGAEQWRAAGNHVVLNFVDIPQLGSADALDRWLGVVREREMAIWVPVVDVRRERVAWAVPYMFVDSGLAMSGGRETYGFPKQLGRLLIPRSDICPDKLAVSSVTFRRHAPEATATLTQVVRVTCVGPPGTPLGSSWPTPAQAARDLAGLAVSQHRAPGVSSEPAMVTAAHQSLIDRFRNPQPDGRTILEDTETQCCWSRISPQAACLWSS